MQVCRRLWDQGAAVRVGVGSAVSPVSRLAASYKQASAMAALASEMRPVVHYERWAYINYWSTALLRIY